MQRSITYKVMSNSIAFVIGFSIIFIFVIGSFAGSIAEFLKDENVNNIISKALGALVIILGIHMLGIFRIKSLMSEKRFQFTSRRFGLIGSALVGMAFSFGWTPCIGPILAAIFALAQESGGYLNSLLLMTAYSLGLAIPFLLTGLAVGQFLKWFNKFKHHFRKVEIISGVLVIMIGVLIFIGALTQLNQYFAGLGNLQSGIEEGVTRNIQGENENPPILVHLVLAFLGGVISFLSPCVLPLVPMYLDFISGVSISEMTAEASMKKSESADSKPGK